MEKNKSIQSLTFTSGNHTFYIDVRTTTGNRKYLSISKSRQMPGAPDERHEVLVEEESVHEVAAALQAILGHFPTPVKQNMEAPRGQYPNAFKPWTREDDHKLELLYYEGRPPAEIARIFQRNVGAIHSRMEKLKLKQKFHQV